MATIFKHNCRTRISRTRKIEQTALTDLKKHKYIDVGHFDAVVNTVGVFEYVNFTEMTEGQCMSTILSKMMEQINIVRIGQEYIAVKGSFTLIAGILNVKPIPFAIADATTSGAIDTFVKCVAFEMPRGIL